MQEEVDNKTVALAINVTKEAVTVEKLSGDALSLKLYDKDYELTDKITVALN